MSTETPPGSNPKTPPATDAKKEPIKKDEHLKINDWNIIITDEGKVQMEKEELNKILNTMNSQVSMHDSFVKKTMAKDKTAMIVAISKDMDDPDKQKAYQVFLTTKTNQELELIQENMAAMGLTGKDITFAPPQTSTQTPPPSTHNQADQTSLQGRHSPTSLVSKKDNTYNCSGCSKTHKLDDFY